MDELTNWKIFQGNRKPHQAIKHLSPPPKWRRFNNQDESTINAEIEQRWRKLQELAKKNTRNKERGESFCIQTDQRQDDDNDKYNLVDAVNASL